MVDFITRGNRNKGDKPGAGPKGYCICTQCKYKTAHRVGYPCNQRICPKCGAKMTRQ